MKVELVVWILQNAFFAYPCDFVAESSRYAAECFRLDALDYLEGEVEFSIFFQAVNKAVRWFALQNSPVAEGVVQKWQSKMRPV